MHRKTLKIRNPPNFLDFSSCPTMSADGTTTALTVGVTSVALPAMAVILLVRHSNDADLSFVSGIAEALMSGISEPLMSFMVLSCFVWFLICDEKYMVPTVCFRTTNHRKIGIFFVNSLCERKRRSFCATMLHDWKKHRRIRESMNTWERIFIRSSFTLEWGQSANNRKLGTCTRLASFFPESELSCFDCSHRRFSNLLVALSLPFLVLLLMAIRYHYSCSYCHRFSSFFLLLLLEISITMSGGSPVLD